MRTVFCLALSVCLMLSTHAEFAPDFVVALDGDDSNPGTIEKPFATIEKAQKAVRRVVKKKADKNIVVALRGGRYVLKDTLVFEPRDGGNAECRVTYTAYPGETPVLSGGRVIANWTSAGKDQWQTTVPSNWAFRQLFKDGQRLTRGRYPNYPALLHLKEVSSDVTRLSVNETMPEMDLAGRNAELIVLQNWTVTRGLIANATGNTLTTATAMGWIGHPWTTASAGKPIFLENAPGFVDVPGEWYLDYETGLLTYQAESDEDPNESVFIAPQLEQILLVEGDRDHQVMNLHFVGLHIEHAEWKLPEVGYRGTQACHYGTTMKERAYPVGGGIEFCYAEDCSIERSVIKHFGPSGIVFGPRTRNNVVIGCVIEDIGCNGIMVGWRMKAELGPPDRHPDNLLDADWGDTKDVPTNNRIVSNTVRDCGAFNYGAVGIYDAYCAATRIAHNLVYDMPYTGISVGFRWSVVPSSQRDTLIEYNHVHTVMTKLADGGCLYTLGYQPGTVVRGNVFHDALRSAFAHGGAPNNGIFFDEGSKGIEVVSNTIYNCAGGPIRFNQTNKGNMSWKDNSFGVGIQYQLQP